MGGKTKQSQRTKNNARPSSSGRSAELVSGLRLEAELVNVAGTQLPALFPSLAGATLDPLISPELQLCFKKLNKKDPITKTKALQELTELVSNSKVDEVVAALPSWVHFYKILTADPDRKVRECTQACHGAVVSASGRRVAPHLRALVPSWLAAQYDDHAPAQTLANNSLTKTFPGNKLPEVLSFCKEEIMSSLLDGLVGASEPAHFRATDSPEERTLQMSLVVCSALHGVQFTVRHLPGVHDAWLWTQLERLLTAPAFWKRATHADIKIRAAWHGALGSVVTRYKDSFGDKYGTRTLRVLVGARESNPLVAAPLWDCLLLFMHNVQDWHQYLENKDLLTKRILDVLDSGGWGDARHLCNMLLPLLANMPDVILTKEFHVAFFNAILSGLDKKSILSSKSERQSWMRSLDECLRYISIQQQQREYSLEIVTSVHRAWLERVLGQSSSTSTGSGGGGQLVKYSAATMANLVKYWLKQAQAQDNDNNHYDQLIRNFWQNVGSTLSAQIDKLSLSPSLERDRDDIEKLIETHILLLQTLKTSFAQEPRKHHTIKFEADSQPAEETTPVETQPTAPTSASASSPDVAQRYNHNLGDLVHNICGEYLVFASDKQISKPVISPLLTLLCEFDSSALFVSVARRFHVDGVYALYESVLRPWLAGDVMRCKELATVAFMLLRHLNDTQQDDMFHTFRQFPPSVVEWCISLSLSHPHFSHAATRRWLRGSLVEGTVDAVCRRLVETGDAPARSLLMQCLRRTDTGESIVSAACVKAALDRLGASLYPVREAALEARCAVAAQLAGTLEPHAALLTALLSLTAELQRGDPRLSLDTWCEVRDAWQDAVTSLPADTGERAAFLRGAAALLAQHIQFKNGTELNVRKIEHIVSLCPYLLWNNEHLDIPETIQFSKHIMEVAEAELPVARVERFAIRHEILAGNLSCPLPDENETIRAVVDGTLTELTKSEVIAYLNRSLFRWMYLRSLFLNQPDDETDRNMCDDLLREEGEGGYFREMFVGALHDYAVLCSLLEGYAFWPHYEMLEQGVLRVGPLVHDIVQRTSAASRALVGARLAEHAAARGYHWARAATLFRDKAAAGDAGGHAGDPVGAVTAMLAAAAAPPPTGSGFFHLLQIHVKGSSETGPVLQTRYLLALRCLHLALGERGELDELCARLASLAQGGWGAGAEGECDDLIVGTYYAHKHVMLYDQDVSSAAWTLVVSNASICDALATRVSLQGWLMEANHWDFANITLCSLLTSVLASKDNWATTKVALLARSALRLFSAVSLFVGTVRTRSSREQPAAHVAALPAEWSDIYAPDIHANLYGLVLHVLEMDHTAVPAAASSCHVAVLDALIGSMSVSRYSWLNAAARARCTLERLARAATSTLAQVAPAAYKYLAHASLRNILEPLVLEDARKLSEWSAGAEAANASASASEEESAAPLRLSLALYDEPFQRLRELVETALEHVTVCEEVCVLVADSDALLLTLGWLLLAEALTEQCRMARTDLAHHYVHIYRERRYAVPLLCAALRLLPGAVLAQASAAGAPGPADSPAHRATTDTYQDMFHECPTLDSYTRCTGARVSALACLVLGASVRGGGAAEARGWRAVAHPRHAALLDNIVKRYVTPRLVRDEFALLQAQGARLEDTAISINWSSYEVTCVLTVDENPVTLTLTLAKQHPLVLPRVASSQVAGNSAWILMYLGYQNGRILDALKMWVQSVNNKMERAPQCYICYCRLHHATGRLPTAACHTCNNKFHNVCLRKWFASSNKMTCPLCRTNF